MKPTISVIIPVYNGANFILDALNSVCDQSFLPLEIVVADDCSTDGTQDVVSAFARTSPVPITLFRMERNTGGPYGPASRAFGRTSGEYICVLDADDMYDPEAFATYMGMFAASPSESVGLATTDFEMFNDVTGETTSHSYFSKFPTILARVLEDSSSVGVLLDSDEALRMQCEAYPFIFKGMIARRAWAALGGPNLNYSHACDCEFVWRLVAKTDFRVRVLNRTLCRLRNTQGSMSKNSIRESRELIKLFRQMLSDIRRRPDLCALVHQRLEKELFDLAYISYKRRVFPLLLKALWDLACARTRRIRFF